MFNQVAATYIGIRKHRCKLGILMFTTSILLNHC